MRTLADFTVTAGEHYRCGDEDYQVASVEQDTVQLRSLRRTGMITCKSIGRFKVACSRGYYVKVAEAPLKGQPNRIVSGLSDVDRGKHNKRQFYVNAVEAQLGMKLPKAETLELINQVKLERGDAVAPSYQTLYNWCRAYRLAGGSTIALVPRPRRAVSRIARQPEQVRSVFNYNVELFYLTRTPLPISEVIDSIIAQLQVDNSKRPLHQQVRVPSFTTFYRLIKELDQFRVDSCQHGSKFAKQRQKWSKKAKTPNFLLEHVECDSQEVDLQLVDDQGRNIGRAWLTALLEVTSRRIIGWDLSLNHPSIEKTIRAIKVSLTPGDRRGAAVAYTCDNGPDFIKKKLADSLALIGAQVIFCEPGVPDQKPHVERWFKTLNTQLTHNLPGTTFSNPIECGDYESKKEAIYTLEQFTELFEQWLEVYHITPHSSLDDTSPNDVWDNNIDPCFPPKTYTLEDIHQIFLSKATAKPVNGRVRYHHLQWTCPAIPYLSTRSRNEVILTFYYDISELGTIWVCDPQDPNKLYAAEAVDPEYQVGLTMAMHDEIHAAMSQRRKAFSFAKAKEQRRLLNLKMQAKRKKATHKSKDSSKTAKATATHERKPATVRAQSRPAPARLPFTNSIPNNAEVVEVTLGAVPPATTGDEHEH